MEREAKCLCGSVKIRVTGEPALSVACNCTNCQRRTGSPFGTMLYYSQAQVLKQTGETRSYAFEVASGNTNTCFFCPTCGSSVFFNTGMFAGQVGIAAGCFNDPDIAAPVVSVWERSKYRWVQFPEQLACLEKQSPG